jgi:glycosyltransferase involved in cell wall biosynthesis
MALEGVSIAMATFNGERFLAAQLSSLVSQTVKPLELVVCDDRSTDSTYTMLQAFAKEAPFPVRLFQNDANVGYRSNFARAGSLCRGSFIFFCDQDDIWRKDKIARVLEYFATSDSLTVSHDLRVFFEDGRPPIGSYFEWIFARAQCEGLRHGFSLGTHRAVRLARSIVEREPRYLGVSDGGGGQAARLPVRCADRLPDP